MKCWYMLHMDEPQNMLNIKSRDTRDHILYDSMYAKHLKKGNKSIETDWCLGQKMGTEINSKQAWSNWGDENVPTLFYGNGCTT